MRRTQNMRGFTLVELVLVLAIIGLLSSMAVPRFGESVARQSADGAARRIAADLAYARRHAMAASTSQVFRVTKTANPIYELVGLRHPDHPSKSYVVYFDADCHGATLDSYDFGGDSDLIFDMYGVPDSAATIVILIGSQQRMITVDAQTGAATISEP